MSAKVWDLTRGFLPKKDPIEKLPKKYRIWNELAEEAPKLLAAEKFGKRLKDLPVLDIDELENDEELECAMRQLSFFGHSEVWESWQTAPKQSISAPVAIPWCKIAKKLDRPPVLSYASYALYNWKRLNKKKTIELGNIALRQNFLGGIDEEWFILVHADIEAKAEKLLPLIMNAPWQLSGGDLAPDHLSRHLINTSLVLQDINATLKRMPENCDPYIYYNRVRPYIHGWKGNPRLAQGIVYEGVAEFNGQPQKWRGETGAQSTIMPSLDAFLGIKHSDALPDGSPDILKTYLLEMREYMPKEHREFLVGLEKRSEAVSIRDYVVKTKAELSWLADAYNACVEEVARFREKHLEYAGNYIHKQAQVGLFNSTVAGTGGTPFMKYLQKHLNETKASIVI